MSQIDTAVEAAVTAVRGSSVRPFRAMGEISSALYPVASIIDMSSSIYQPMTAASRRQLDALRASTVSRAAYDWEVKLKWFLIGALEQATGKKFDNATGWLGSPSHNGGRFQPGLIRFTDGSVL